MLQKDIMTRNVITIPSKTSLMEAKRIMKEHKFRRLPVVDNGKLLGIVTQDRLERVSPSAGTPLLWQINYLISHTTVGDVMEKNAVTISPDATVEQGVALAQSKKVGALLVVDNGKLVGIVTTNDFFYNLVNPMLGIGETGSRIIVPEGGEGRTAEQVLAVINRMKVGIKVIWSTVSAVTKKKDLVLHLDTDEPAPVIAELKAKGLPAQVRPR